MLIVETIGKIRRAFFVQKKPIKVICRTLIRIFEELLGQAGITISRRSV
jgi:hypothetical protein